MDAGLVIEPMSPDDIDEVIGLLGYNVTTETRNYFIWRYQQTPQNQLLVVRDSGSRRIVGFNALVKCPIVFDSVEYEAVQSVDLVVHPEYRRKGIMYDLCMELYGNASRNGSKLAIGWTARGLPAWRGFVYKLDWLDLGLVPDLVYPLKPFRAVNWLGWGRVKRKAGGLLLWLWKTVRRPRSVPRNDLAVETGRWDHLGLWECWKESLESGAAAIKRNTDFYATRFSMSRWPPYEFHPITVREDGRIVSHAICITYVSGQGSAGIIADLHSVRGKQKALRLLIGACIDHFQSEGADFFRLWAKKPIWVTQELEKWGFINRSGNQCFRVRSLADDYPGDSRILDFNIWDIDLCDSDHV